MISNGAALWRFKPFADLASHHNWEPFFWGITLLTILMLRFTESDLIGGVKVCRDLFGLEYSSQMGT